MVAHRAELGQGFPINRRRLPAVVQNVTVTVDGSKGGDPQQNQDLADRIGKQVKNELCGLVGQELRNQGEARGRALALVAVTPGPVVAWAARSRGWQLRGAGQGREQPK